jgi:hypothetical protein
MNYTSREESLKLISLEIDQNTSDLVYVSNIYYPSVLPGVKYLDVKDKIIEKYDGDPNSALPAWTTDALIDLLPRRIKNESGEFQLIIFPDQNTGMWVCMYDRIETHKDCLEVFGDKEYKKAIYKMACWILESKIKKEG